MKLFVYGSLKERGVLERVIGRSWEGHYKAATIHDHIKVQPSWYPMVFEKEGSTVDGFVIDNLSYEDFKELDHYEGLESGLFRRKTVYIPKLDTVAEIYYNGESYKLAHYLAYPVERLLSP